MAWVFANWWQVLIVVWFGGVLNELSSAVFRSRLRWDMQKLSFAAQFGLWLGPFFWPLHLLYLLAIRKTKTGARIDIGPVGMTLQRGLDARRLLEDLTVEFPIEGQKKHVLMLGEKKGELAVCLCRVDGLFERLQLTHEDQSKEHDALVDEICDFVSKLDKEQAAADVQ